MTAITYILLIFFYISQEKRDMINLGRLLSAFTHNKTKLSLFYPYLPPASSYKLKISIFIYTLSKKTQKTPKNHKKRQKTPKNTLKMLKNTIT